MASTVPGITYRSVKGAAITWNEMDTNIGNIVKFIEALAARFDAAFTASGALRAGAISDVDIFTSSVKVQLWDLMAPLGSIIARGVQEAPSSNWLLCDGSAVLRSTYADYYALVGGAFGDGDGVNTFNVPDLRGRAPIGTGQGTGLTLRNIGGSGGEETHLLITDEIPAHHHTLTDLQARTTAGSNAECLNSPNNATTPGTFPDLTTEDTGGDQVHNNMPPWVAVAYYVKVLNPT